MKIKIKKEYVESYQMERVKEDAKEFGSWVKEADLLAAFEEQVKYVGANPEIVKTTVEAMDSGWACGNKTVFVVNMLLDDGNKMYKLRFYVNMELEVDTRYLVDGKNRMYSIKEYEEV